MRPVLPPEVGPAHDARPEAALGSLRVHDQGEEEILECDACAPIDFNPPDSCKTFIVQK